MTAETIHTCSYECERPGCIRAQRDELAARMAAETSNARYEWPERYACNGPEGTFWTDDAALANKLIGAAFDRDEWTVTDTQNPVGAAPPPAAARGDVRGLVDALVDAAYQDGMQELDAMSNETLNARSALEQALAAEGVQTADAEAKTVPVPTRVHLIGETAVIVGTPQRGWDEEGPEAHNCDDMGCSTIGPHVLARVPFTDERALSQQPEARGVVDAKPVGTITRRDSGDEVIEHQIALDPDFEESLYRYPAGTVINLYAEAAADVALAHVQAAAAALTQQPAVVDDVVERIAALLHEEATGEPWDVAGVEHPGPDRDYYRGLASKIAALAAQHQGGSDDA